MKFEIKFVEDEINNDEEVKKQLDSNNEFIRTFINTKLSNYLKFNEILTLVTTKEITEASNIIIKYIKDVISLCNNDIYIYNETINIHHKLNNQMLCDDFLTVFIITFVENSLNKLNKADNATIKKFYKANFVSNMILKMVKANLRVNSDTFSQPKLGEIHFKNGYIKLQDLTFHKRRRTDYMTYCLFRDYKKAPELKREYIENVINQIYPDLNDKNCVLECFGEAISGHSTKSQYNLFLLGIGSSGKSTLMKMSKSSFKEMIFEFKEDTFAVNNTKADRVLNMLMYNPYVRIMWVNELKGKIDDSLFKQICEGQVNTTTLFQEGQNIIKFNALLVNTMNEFPNIKIDSGVERRIKSLEHKSKFTTNKKEVDPKKNIYLADNNLTCSIANDEELQNAFVEIICEYAYEFLNGKRYELSQNFKETKQDIVDTNDIVKEFIMSHVIKTEDENDKVDLHEIFESFKMNFPTSKISDKLLKGILKDKGLIFNANVRSPKDSNKRGCFICIKLKDDNEEGDNPKFHELDGKTIREVVLEKEIENLKRQIEDLQSQLKPVLVKPEIVIKEIIQKAPVNDEDIVVIPKQETETLDDIKALDTHIKNSKKQAKEKQVYKPVRKVVSYKNDTPNSKELDDLLAEIDTV